MAAFSPSDISNLVQWYDASDSDTITESGGVVSQWDDKSTAGNDITQGTSANRPTISSAAVNGLDAMAFDDSADSGNGQFFTGSFVYDVPVCCFMAVQTDDQNANKHIIHWGASSSSSLSVASVYTTGLSCIPYDGGVAQPAVSGGALTNNQTHILSALFQADNDRRARRDGGNEGTNTSNEPVTPTTTFTLGKYGASIVDRPWSGYICEVVVYNKQLSDQEIAQVETYLASKWAAPSHDFTLAPDALDAGPTLGTHAARLYLLEPTALDAGPTLGSHAAAINLEVSATALDAGPTLGSHAAAVSNPVATALDAGPTFGTHGIATQVSPAALDAGPTLGTHSAQLAVSPTALDAGATLGTHSAQLADTATALDASPTLGTHQVTTRVTATALDAGPTLGAHQATLPGQVIVNATALAALALGTHAVNYTPDDNVTWIARSWRRP